MREREKKRMRERFHHCFNPQMARETRAGTGLNQVPAAYVCFPRGGKSQSTWGISKASSGILAGNWIGRGAARS